MNISLKFFKQSLDLCFLLDSLLLTKEGILRETSIHWNIYWHHKTWHRHWLSKQSLLMLSGLLHLDHWRVLELCWRWGEILRIVRH